MATPNETGYDQPLNGLGVMAAPAAPPTFGAQRPRAVAELRQAGREHFSEVTGDRETGNETALPAHAGVGTYQHVVRQFYLLSTALPEIRHLVDPRRTKFFDPCRRAFAPISPFLHRYEGEFLHCIRRFGVGRDWCRMAPLEILFAIDNGLCVLNFHTGLIVQRGNRVGTMPTHTLWYDGVDYGIVSLRTALRPIMIALLAPFAAFPCNHLVVSQCQDTHFARYASWYSVSKSCCDLHVERMPPVQPTLQYVEQVLAAMNITLEELWSDSQRPTTFDEFGSLNGRRDARDPSFAERVLNAGFNPHLFVQFTKEDLPQSLRFMGEYNFARIPRNCSKAVDKAFERGPPSLIAEGIERREFFYLDLISGIQTPRKPPKGAVFYVLGVLERDDRKSFGWILHSTFMQLKQYHAETYVEHEDKSTGPPLSTSGKHAVEPHPSPISPQIPTTSSPQGPIDLPHSPVVPTSAPTTSSVSPLIPTPPSLAAVAAQPAAPAPTSKILAYVLPRTCKFGKTAPSAPDTVVHSPIISAQPLITRFNRMEYERERRRIHADYIDRHPTPTITGLRKCEVCSKQPLSEREVTLCSQCDADVRDRHTFHRRVVSIAPVEEVRLALPTRPVCLRCHSRPSIPNWTMCLACLHTPIPAAPAPIVLPPPTAAPLPAQPVPPVVLPAPAPVFAPAPPAPVPAVVPPPLFPVGGTPAVQGCARRPASYAKLFVDFPKSCVPMSCAFLMTVTEFHNWIANGHRIPDHAISDHFCRYARDILMNKYDNYAESIKDFTNAVLGLGYATFTTHQTATVAAMLSSSYSFLASECVWRDPNRTAAVRALFAADPNDDFHGLFGVPIIAARRRHFRTGHGLHIDFGHVQACFDIDTDPTIQNTITRVLRVLNSELFHMVNAQMGKFNDIISTTYQLDDHSITEMHKSSCPAICRIRSRGFLSRFVQRYIIHLNRDIDCQCQRPALDFQVGGAFSDPLTRLSDAAERFLDRNALTCTNLPSAEGLFQHYTRVIQDVQNFTTAYCVAATDRADAVAEHQSLNFGPIFCSRAMARAKARQSIKPVDVEPNHQNTDLTVAFTYPLDDFSRLNGKCSYKCGLCGRISPKRRFCKTCRQAAVCPLGHFVLHTKTMHGEMHSCGICDEQKFRATKAQEAYTQDARQQLASQHLSPITYGVAHTLPFYNFAKRLDKIGVVDPSVKYEVYSKESTPIRQRGAVATGICSGAGSAITAICDPRAAYSAMTARQLVATPPVDVAAIREMRAIMFTSKFFQLAQTAQYMWGHPWVPRHRFPDWARRFPVARRNDLYASREVYRIHGLTKKMTHRAVFLKHEKLELGRPGVVEETKASRVISSLACTEHGLVPQFLLGPWMFSMGHLLKEHFNGKEVHASGEAKDPTVFYASGCTNLEIGAWFDMYAKDFPHIVGADYSKYDKSIGRHQLCAEHDLYRTLFPPSSHIDSHMLRDMAIVLRRQLRPKGTVKVRQEVVARYETDGRRSSGDSNTSCGNFIVSAAMLLAGLRSIVGGGVNDDAVSNNFRLALCGDDVLILSRIHPAIWQQRLVAYVARFGHTLEAEHHPTRASATFVGSRPIRCQDDGLQMTRTVFVPVLERWMLKHGWSIDGWTDQAAYVRQVAQGWAALDWVPIIGKVIRRELELTQGASKKTQQISDRPQLTYVKAPLRCHPLTYSDFYDAYQISLESVIEIERMMDQISSLPAFVHHPDLDRVVRGGVA